MNYPPVHSYTRYSPLSTNSPWHYNTSNSWTADAHNPWTHTPPQALAYRTGYPNVPQNTRLHFDPFTGHTTSTTQNSSVPGQGWETGFGDIYFPHVFNRPAPAPLPRRVQPIAPPAPRKIVAANEHSSYWGDPHVADADRAEKGNNRHNSFIVKGDGIFQLLKDKDVFLNGVHKKYPQWDYEVTDRIGLRVAGLNIEMGAYDAAPKINGASFKGEKILPNGTKVAFDGTKLSVSTGDSGEYDFEIAIVHAEHKNPDGSPIKYLDTDIRTKSKGVALDGVMPTGILGEGFDADDKARTQLNNPLDTYKRGGLFQP